jgi:hypothetical protein
MPVAPIRATLAVVVFAVLCAARAEAADPASPSPSASPAVSPSPSPRAFAAHRFRVSAEDALSYVSQRFAGPGTRPPDGAAFASGSPVAPQTPYDLWTASPTVTGYGVVHGLVVSPSYALSPQYAVAVRAGYGSLSGNANVAAYWGDQPLPSLNPHLGARAIPVAFPNANGADAFAASGAAVLGASLERADGALAVRAGWFDLAQGETFVVNQPAATNTPLLFTEPLPEGIGESADLVAPFSASRAPLPLYGLDLTGRPRAGVSVELVDAALPEPPGTQARLLGGSLAVARDRGVAYGAQIAHLRTAGAPIGTPVLFGANAATTPSDLGPLPTSSLAAQRMTIAGARAEATVFPAVDARIRLGYSCYSARVTALARAGCTPGGFGALRLRRVAGAFELSAEAMRMDATYAPAILPYGTPENVWGAGYAWPGTWLKGTYQLVDDAAIGPNRQGARATARVRAGALDARLAYGTLHQLRPYDASTAYEPGFVESFYFAQLAAPGTLGDERHAAAALIARPRFATVELDLTDVTLMRRGSSGHPEERVALDNGAATVTLSRRFGPAFFGSAGAGRYAMTGAFDSAGTNVDLTERVVFGALAWSASPHLAYALQYRLYAACGMPSAFGGSGFVSPAYHGAQLMLEQRVHL